MAEKEALFMSVYGMKIFVNYKIAKIEFVKFTLLKLVHAVIFVVM